MQRFLLVSPVSAQAYLRWASVGFDRSAPHNCSTRERRLVCNSENAVVEKTVRSGERTLAHATS